MIYYNRTKSHFRTSLPPNVIIPSSVVPYYSYTTKKIFKKWEDMREKLYLRHLCKTIAI